MLVRESVNYRSFPAALETFSGFSERVQPQDHKFSTRGDVFTEDLIRAWIDYKREKELDPIRLRPHPHEFSLYYDN